MYLCVRLVHSSGKEEVRERRRENPGTRLSQSGGSTVVSTYLLLGVSLVGKLKATVLPESQLALLEMCPPRRLGGKIRRHFMTKCP